MRDRIGVPARCISSESPARSFILRATPWRVVQAHTHVPSSCAGDLRVVPDGSGVLKRLYSRPVSDQSVSQWPRHHTLFDVRQLPRSPLLFDPRLSLTSPLIPPLYHRHSSWSCPHYSNIVCYRSKSSSSSSDSLLRRHRGDSVAQLLSTNSSLFADRFLPRV